MSESDDAASPNAPARYPFINLEKSVGRAQQLFDADQRGRAIGMAAVFATWEYSEKSSGGFQTVAALKMYGLIQASGGQVMLTPDGLRYFRDEREDEKKKLARGFALKPKLFNSLWETWQDSPPADTVARSHLKAERGLNDQAARTVLAIYKENIAFAELKGLAKMVEENDVEVAKVMGNPNDLATQPQRHTPQKQVATMPGERVVFVEEGGPAQYLKVVAAGDVDDGLLEALQDYVKRQRKRLAGRLRLEFHKGGKTSQPFSTPILQEASLDLAREIGKASAAMRGMGADYFQICTDDGSPLEAWTLIGKDWIKDPTVSG